MDKIVSAMRLRNVFERRSLNQAASDGSWYGLVLTGFILNSR